VSVDVDAAALDCSSHLADLLGAELAWTPAEELLRVPA